MLSISLPKLIRKENGKDREISRSSKLNAISNGPATLEIEESCRNPLFPAAHSVVKFEYQPHRGRYAVAEQDIEVILLLSVKSVSICSQNR